MDGALCPYSAFISSVFLLFSPKLTDTDKTEQEHHKRWGSVAVTSIVALVRHEEETSVVELFEENRNACNHLNYHSLLQC